MINMGGEYSYEGFKAELNTELFFQIGFYFNEIDDAEEIAKKHYCAGTYWHSFHNCMNEFLEKVL